MKKKGSTALSEFYGDRWASLFESISRPHRKVARLNHFRATEADLTQFQFDFEYRGQKGIWLKDSEQDLQIQELAQKGIFYIMDPSSLYTATVLESLGDRVLDLCASPGGKALILAESISQLANFSANEFSKDRRLKLISVLKLYLGERYQSSMVLGIDGTLLWRSQLPEYDTILIDAPCSGEKYQIKNWNESEVLSKSRHLQFRQRSLLAAALEKLSPNGHLIYSTCSLNPQENDGAIEWLLKRATKKNQNLKVLDLPSPLAEKTAYGYAYLPDRVSFGPSYYAVIQKK